MKKLMKVVSVLFVSLFVTTSLFAASLTPTTDSMIGKIDIGTYVDGELQLR